jgi:uroporphyrinogen decarboxylase
MIHSSDLFLRNCAGEVTAQKPVWIMRQAGRYLTEYKEVRSRFPSFIDFYKNPEACCEVTMQPLEKFGLDAAILFSDILTLLPPLGLDLEFVTGKGPVVKNPLRTLEDAQNLKKVSVENDLWFVAEAVKLITKKLDSRLPLLGFAGGPLTVASYAIEGGSSKELANTKELLFSNPEAFHLIMDTITTLTIEYLKMQVHFGANVLVVMDSWAGHFSIQDYQESIFPYTQRIFQELKQSVSVPLLHYANGAAHLLPNLVNLDCHGLGLDWRMSLDQAIQLAPQKIYQGNLDPCTLYAPDELIIQKTREILEKVQNRPHIMNLGHGVLPTTPVHGVHAFLNAIRNQ